MSNIANNPVSEHITTHKHMLTRVFGTDQVIGERSADGVKFV